MSKVKVTVKMKQAAVNQLRDSYLAATLQTAEALIEEVKDAQVIPYETGELQDSLHVEQSQNLVQIVQETDYAQRLYYHPEYQFKKTVNKNAQGEWWQPWISGDKIRSASRLFKEFYLKLTGRYVVKR